MNQLNYPNISKVTYGDEGIDHTLAEIANKNMEMVGRAERNESIKESILLKTKVVALVVAGGYLAIHAKDLIENLQLTLIAAGAFVCAGIIGYCMGKR